MAPKKLTTRAKKHSRSSNEDVEFDENGEGELYEAVAILAERKGYYKVEWAGEDPKTNKPWRPTWERKQDCTPALVASWKAKQTNEGPKAVEPQPASQQEDWSVGEQQFATAQVPTPAGKANSKVLRQSKRTSALKDAAEKGRTGMCSILYT